MEKIVTDMATEEGNRASSALRILEILGGRGHSVKGTSGQWDWVKVYSEI